MLLLVTISKGSVACTGTQFCGQSKIYCVSIVPFFVLIVCLLCAYCVPIVYLLCTGTQFCGQSKINTKGNTVKFAEILDAKFDFPEGKDVRIHWTGVSIVTASVYLLCIYCVPVVGRQVQLPRGEGRPNSLDSQQVLKSSLNVKESCYWGKRDL